MIVANMNISQLNTVVAFGRLTEELDDGCPQVVQRFLTNTCTQNKNITATEYLRFRCDSLPHSIVDWG